MVIDFIKPKLTFYDKCENMPLWNFQKYLETNDLRYFTKEFKTHKDLYDIMVSLFGEYLELTNNQSIINRFGLMFKIMKLTGKYNSVSMLIQLAYNFPKETNIEKFTELISEIEKHNYRIDRNKEIFDQLEKINNRIQGIKTQLVLLNDELKAEDTKESVTIESQLIQVNRTLELGYRLDPKVITLKEWNEYKNQSREVVKQRQKTTVKNGK